MIDYKKVIKEANNLSIDQIDALFEIPSGMDVMLGLSFEDLTKDELFKVTTILRRIKQEKETVKDKEGINNAIGNAVKGVLFPL